jgi:tetratricopeptide (TPR) repeat protein
MSRAHRHDAVDELVDKIEDRLRDAPEGLHRWGEPANAAAVRDAGLTGDAARLWLAFDGLELGVGEATIHPVAGIAAATAAALADGRVEAGDRVIGEWGRELLVLPADAWAEGAEVIGVSEDGDRSPEASSVVHMVLQLLGVVGILLDESGEYADELFDEASGELLPAVERRLVRRRLDHDPDAPAPRLRLVQLLRAAGELRAAKAEIKQTLLRAPDWAEAHEEKGRVAFALAQQGQGPVSEAERAFAKAGELFADPDRAAHAWAWAARCAEEGTRAGHAAKALARAPEFARTMAMGARELAEAEGDEATLRELVALGLAVQPGHLELLTLRRRLDP